MIYEMSIYKLSYQELSVNQIEKYRRIKFEPYQLDLYIKILQFYLH